MQERFNRKHFICVILCLTLFTTLFAQTFVAAEVLYGDANSDGATDAVDSVDLSRYLAKWTGYSEINTTNSDLDLDGSITSNDSVILSRHVAKWSGYLQLPLGEVTYTVTFVDYDGTVLKTESNISSGASATAPDAPSRGGYNFIGWDVAFDNVTSNLTVTAQYKEILPTIVVEDAYAKVGDETVSVNISILNNPGISSLIISVGYSEVLTLSSIEYNTEFGDFITAPEPFENPQIISMISPFSDISTSGTYATLTFAVSSGVTAATTVPVTVTYDAENTFKKDFEPVAFDVVSGTVVISE